MTGTGSRVDGDGDERNSEDKSNFAGVLELKCLCTPQALELQLLFSLVASRQRIDRPHLPLFVLSTNDALSSDHSRTRVLSLYIYIFIDIYIYIVLFWVFFLFYCWFIILYRL